MDRAMTEARCNCIECKVRRALSDDGDVATAPFAVDINEALKAIGTVAAEMLAHHPTKAAKRWADAVLDARKKWQKHPRVVAQQEPAGHA